MSSLLPLADLALRLGRVNRATLHPDGERWESDTDHTVMLGLIAVSVAAEHPELHLDLGQVALFALIHDLVEAHAGDTPSFVITDDQRTAKAAREAWALHLIEEECTAFSWIGQMIRHYERQERREARLVRYLDKVCPKLTHTLNGGEAIRRLGYDRERMIEQHRRQIEALSVEYPEFAEVCGTILRLACDEAERAWSAP